MLGSHMYAYIRNQVSFSLANLCHVALIMYLEGLRKVTFSPTILKQKCLSCKMPTRQIECGMDVPSIYPNLGNPSVERTEPDVKAAR